MKHKLLRFPTYILSMLVVGSLVFFASCKDEDEPEPPKTVVDIAIDNGFNELAAALTEAGLVDALNGPGPFTVFAPTDAAFDALYTSLGVSGPAEVDDMVLSNLLQYHVLSGNVTSGDLTSGNVTMLNGADASIDASVPSINDANIIAPLDLTASNGVVHTIDAVIMPPKTIVEIAIEAGYTTLAAGLEAAGLVETLNGPGPFTVFAPTNETFEAAGITADNIAGIAGLEEILLYHVVSGNIKSTDLTTGNVATLNGQEIAIDATALTVNGNAIAEPFDVEGSNGVIHTVGGVLIPEFDIVTSALFYGYNTLAAAVVEAELDDDLSGTGPFTVFAPTDAAFEAAGITPENVSTVDNLANILLYHVLAGDIRSGDLTTGDFETLSGKEVAIDATALTVDNSNIAEPFDVGATNGVIHTIDAVLLPKSNIVELASASENLSILVDALTKFPDLVELLSDESGTYTVFAPTNAAFEALLPVIKQTSIDDIPEDVLKNILQFHVIAGSEVFSGDLAPGTVEAANMEDITITEPSAGVFQIEGQDINTADQDASNGVVHIMDGVLVPPSVTPFVGNALTFAYFSKDFTTLVAAVSASDPSLVPALQAADITLFAPTNAAFEAAGITEIPAEPTLSAVLTYHVIGAVVEASDIPTTAAAAPLEQATLGGNIYISNQGGDAGVFINGSTEVTAFDLTADNGAVVHVINRTLLPPSMTIAGIATDLGFTRLVDALVEAGLDGIFADPDAGPFTVFAPTNDAFDALYDLLGVDGPAEIADATLEAVLNYHVLDNTQVNRVFSTDLVDGLAAPTLQGGNITVNISGDGVVTLTDVEPDNDDAQVVATDVLGTNGVVHAIDAVILPVDL